MVCFFLFVGCLFFFGMGFVFVLNHGEMHFSFALVRWELWLLSVLLFTLVARKQFSEFTV